jgi:uncharacterized membrane protein
MGTAERPSWREKNRVLIAIYANEEKADDVVKTLIDKGFQMDLISMLGKMHAIGDDTLGIYKLNAGERMMAWGKQGAFWGGLWGALAGAAGLFVVPGIGAVAAAGFIVETIVGGLGGAVAGAGTMAGAAALSQLSVALHRSGIPDEKIHALHEAIEHGKYVLMLREAESEIEQWGDILAAGKPVSIDNLPYTRLIDKD